MLAAAAAEDGRLEDVEAWFLRRREELHASPDGTLRTLVQRALATAWSGLRGYSSADEARAALQGIERRLADWAGPT